MSYGMARPTSTTPFLTETALADQPETAQARRRKKKPQAIITHATHATDAVIDLPILEPTASPSRASTQ